MSVLAKPLNNAQIVRGVFVYTLLNMANLVPFTKRFESSENLIDLLESRGLQICDRNKAIQNLDNIGYYRLSAYMYPLLKMPKTAHLYKEGATFKQVMMLYRFDKKLRLLMFNDNDIQSKLTWLFIRFPEIDLKALGFPQGWKMEPLWQ